MSEAGRDSRLFGVRGVSDGEQVDAVSIRVHPLTMYPRDLRRRKKPKDSLTNGAKRRGWKVRAFSLSFFLFAYRHIDFLGCCGNLKKKRLFDFEYLCKVISGNSFWRRRECCLEEIFALSFAFLVETKRAGLPEKMDFFPLQGRTKSGGFFFFFFNSNWRTQSNPAKSRNSERGKEMDSETTQIVMSLVGFQLEEEEGKFWRSLI